MKSKKKYVVITSIFVFLIASGIWIAWSNTALTVRELTVVNADLPENFSGYRIAQVSDLHNAEFGSNNEILLNKLADCDADIIVITGDLIDSRHTNIDAALEFVQNAIQIAPIYYVTGNHESRIKEYELLEQGLMECGARVLRNEMIDLELEGQTIKLGGIDDPAFAGANWYDTSDAEVAEKSIKQFDSIDNKFTILLSHRPELFDIYLSNEVDLVLSGHAHGGQFRLPFLGGVVAPDQGLFPKYDSGLYTEHNTNMVVSRGLGNSIFPFRVNNPPEIVVVRLQKNDNK